MMIKIDDLTGQEIAEFLDQHIQEMRSVSPPESKHALDISDLRKPDITFWTVWDAETLTGCGAIKELDPWQGEIKSMRVALSHRRQGVASLLLRHMIAEAKSRKYHKLSLETGSMSFFEPARQLYQKFGFVYCSPFASYTEDPNSVFMSLLL